MPRFLPWLAAMVLSLAAPSNAAEVEFETTDGIRIVGDLYRSAGGDDAAIVLLFHQAQSSARGEYAGIAARLVDEGYNVLAIDQRSGGELFGAANRTRAGLGERQFGYCEVYPDLEAALHYVRDAGFSGPLAAWGSSYSAALVFELAARNPQEVDALLAFSPASGPPLADCPLSAHLKQLETPALALRPQKEFVIETVQAQMKEFESHGVKTFVADPGVHGSSMLDAGRVGAPTTQTWQVVLDFLDVNLRRQQAQEPQLRK